MVTPSASRRDRVRAEAAVWLTRIQRETGVEESRQALQDWLALDPEHRLAFQQVTETWEFLPGAAALMSPQHPAPARSSRGSAPRRSAVRPALVGLGLAACVLARWRSSLSRLRRFLAGLLEFGVVRVGGAVWAACLQARPCLLWALCPRGAWEVGVGRGVSVGAAFARVRPRQRGLRWWPLSRGWWGPVWGE